MMLNSSDRPEIFSKTSLTHQETGLSFLKRCYSLFVFGGASKWIPSLGSRFGARHRKHTIYKQLNLLFFTLLKLKFSLGIKFQNKSEKMFDQIIFYSLKIRLFLLRKIFSNSSLTDKQNMLFFSGNFIGCILL